MARPRLGLLCLAACALLGAGAEADVSILEQARVLARQMHKLAADELGVVTMQVGTQRTPPRSRALLLDSCAATAAPIPPLSSPTRPPPPVSRLARFPGAGRVVTLCCRPLRRVRLSERDGAQEGGSAGLGGGAWEDLEPRAARGRGHSEPRALGKATGRWFSLRGREGPRGWERRR